jgi:hypothetical protein
MHNIICLAKDATLRPKKDKDVLSLESQLRQEWQKADSGNGQT